MDDDLTAVEHPIDERRAPCEALRPSERPRGVPALRRVRGRNYQSLGVADLEPREIERAVEAPDSLLTSPAALVVKKGRSALIVKAALRRAGGETRVACKRSGSKTWLRRLARGLQTSRAVRNFRLGNKLLRGGIATARPLLAVSPRWHAFLCPCYLATEWLDDAVPIDAFFREAALGSLEKQAILRETADCVGRLLGTLHARGLAHRDLKATNLLVRERCGRIEVFVIDLDGVSSPWFLTRRTRMKNLARLVVATQGMTAVTHALRRRVLRAYLDTTRDRDAWKTVWREADKISRIRRARRAARRP